MLHSRLVAIAKSNQTWKEMGYDKKSIPTYIFQAGDNTSDSNEGPWEPVWQMSPPPLDSRAINLDLRSIPSVVLLETATDTLGHGLMGDVRDDFAADQEKGGPQSLLVQPIFESIYTPQTHSRIVGHVFSIVTWDAYFLDLQQEGVSDVTIVLRNTCGQEFTYELDGDAVSLRMTFHHLELGCIEDWYRVIDTFLLGIWRRRLTWA